VENLTYAFAASARAQAVQKQILVGVVGSGDLEVLVEPQSDQAQIRIQICTSVDGMASIWEALMARLFAQGTLPAMRIDINDFGATPGVVRLRVEQALEELGLSDQSME